jgi:hypothetical protein
VNHEDWIGSLRPHRDSEAGPDAELESTGPAAAVPPPQPHVGRHRVVQEPRSRRRRWLRHRDAATDDRGDDHSPDHPPAE